MKTTYKIIIANLVLAILTTAFLLPTQGGYSNGRNTATAFGLVCLGLGVFDFFAAFILLLARKKSWGQAMLLSCAVLLLLSGISCSQGFS